MKQSNKLLTILLLLNCPFAFAGTGSAQDGYSIIVMLAGILIVITGTPYLLRYMKKAWQLIRDKIGRYFDSITEKKTNTLLSNYY